MTQVVEIIIIKEPSSTPRSRNNKPNIKKRIKGPHFKQSRQSVKGRMLDLIKGLR
jgi:hypothetical protein